MKTLNQFRQTNTVNLTFAEVEEIMQVGNQIKADPSVKSLIAVVREDRGAKMGTVYTIRLIDVLGNLVDLLVVPNTNSYSSKRWMIIEQEIIRRNDLKVA